MTPLRSLLVAMLSIGLSLWVPALAEGPGEGGSDDAPFDDYVVGIEDGLRIVTWGEADLTLDAIVRPDGKITLPLINDVHVAGRTPTEIRAVLVEKLSEFIREPQVTVIVVQINSYRVYMLGEVQSQGVLTFGRPVRLLQAIAAAGGLTEFAKKNITLVREMGGVERRIAIDYKRLLEGHASQENLYLRPGDMLLFY